MNTTVVYDHQIFVLQRFGGISRYFCEVAARIDAMAGFSSKIIAPIHVNDYLAAYTAPKLAKQLVMRVPRIARLYMALDRCASPLAIRACHPGIVHRTYYAKDYRPRHTKLVVTVFDMIHELYPQYFSAKDNTTELKKRAVSEADHVLCISHSTANDLQRLLHVPAHKLSVTHLGFSDAFSAAASSAGEAAGARPYILYVGLRHVYKNFERMLKAYAGSARLSADFDLVAFGGRPFSAHEQSLIESLVRRRGAVRQASGPDSALASAYKNAHAFVYPSEYEGFGIPPLEAMSCGCPVVCALGSSIPEVVGDAGQYFDPTSVEAIRDAIEAVCYDDDRRSELVRLGFEQRKRFSWDRCAEETAAVYRRLTAA